jgi:hypothetical protein
MKYRLESCFTAELRARVPQLTWYGERRDQNAVTPYGVVSAETVGEINQDTGVYHADLGIGIVTNIDESTTEDVAKLAAAVEQALNEMPRAGCDEELKLVLNGWNIVEIGTASKNQDFANVFTLRIGCAKLEKLQTGDSVQTPLA